MLTLDVLYRTNGLLLSLYEEVLGERRRRDYLAAVKRRGEVLPLLVADAGRELWTPEQDAALPLEGDQSAYLGEVKTPIGVLLERGTWFTKSWQLRNAGTVAWRDRFLQRVGPNAAATLVATERIVAIPDTDPGQDVLVEIRARAQWIESTSVAHFKMVFADGRLCWPDRYSHGVDLLVTAVRGPSCSCVSCRSVGPLQARHHQFAVGKS